MIESTHPELLGLQQPGNGAALEDAKATLDVEARTAAYAKVQEIWAEDMPYVYTIRTLRGTYLGEDIEGVEMFNDGVLFLGNLWLDE